MSQDFMNQMLMLLRERQNRVDRAGRGVEQANSSLQRASAPVNTQFANPGQTAGQVMTDATGPQRRAMIQMGAEMARDSSRVPGAAMASGFASGFDLLDQIRRSQREQGMQQATAGVKTARERQRMAESDRQAAKGYMDTAAQLQHAFGEKPPEDNWVTREVDGNLVRLNLRNGEMQSLGRSSSAYKADQEAKQEAAMSDREKEETAQRHLAELRKNENVIAQAEKALELVDKGAGGLSSTITDKIGYKAGDEGQLRAILGKIIGSNTAFDRLQQMRDASKTGGALGQVSIIELEMLKNSIDALDPELGEDVLKASLANIIRHYNNARKAIMGEMPEVDFNDPLYRNNIVELSSGKKVLHFPDGSMMEVVPNAE